MPASRIAGSARDPSALTGRAEGEKATLLGRVACDARWRFEVGEPPGSPGPFHRSAARTRAFAPGSARDPSARTGRAQAGTRLTLLASPASPASPPQPQSRRLPSPAPASDARCGGRTTGFSWRSSARSARPGTSSISPSTRRSCSAPDSTTGSPRRAPSSSPSRTTTPGTASGPSAGSAATSRTRACAFSSCRSWPTSGT
jgi:hypothetical protein